jgi:hypothetical protein
MPEVHMVVGITLIAANAIVGIWGLIAYRRDAPPGRFYIHALAIAQTAVIAQASLGLILLSEGHRPGDKLHFAYGLLPLLAIAYPYALRGEDGRRNLFYFAVGASVVAALGVRAYMTGPS